MTTPAKKPIRASLKPGPMNVRLQPYIAEDGTPFLAFATFNTLPPGVEIVGNGTLPHPLDVRLSGHFALFAEIRTDSKYYKDQGLSATGKPERYPVDSIDTRRQDGYVFRFARNIYRREDCILFARVDGRDVRLT